MTPDVVVDIGNTRMKWGRCAAGRVAEMVALPHDDPAAWAEQAARWELPVGAVWAAGGVAPAAVDALAAWVESSGGRSVVFRKPSALPIRLDLDEPDAVGIDRVFGAIAARAAVPPGTPALTVDVGTAVTVNLIDAAGVFRGGAIFPGPRLMALALRQNTAKLPLVELPLTEADGPIGRNTAAAIRYGLDAALAGGVNQLVSIFPDPNSPPPWLFLTGGGREFLGWYRSPAVAETVVVPELNLEGVRLAAEALP